MPKAKTMLRSELESVGDILGPRYKYKVPIYQRNFSWSSVEQVTRLWDDILASMQDRRAEYFLGTIVVEEDREAKTRTIIDGQQRLATLTMIFSAIRTIYTQKKDDRGLEIEKEYLGIRDRRTREYEARLKLNLVNEPLFERLVVQNASDTEIQTAISDKKALPTNIALAKAIQTIRQKVIAEVQRGLQNFWLTLRNTFAIICL